MEPRVAVGSTPRRCVGPARCRRGSSRGRRHSQCKVADGRRRREPIARHRRSGVASRVTDSGRRALERRAGRQLGRPDTCRRERHRSRAARGHRRRQPVTSIARDALDVAAAARSTRRASDRRRDRQRPGDGRRARGAARVLRDRRAVRPGMPSDRGQLASASVRRVDAVEDGHPRASAACSAAPWIAPAVDPDGTIAVRSAAAPPSPVALERELVAAPRRTTERR